MATRNLAAVPEQPALDLGSHDLNLQCPDCHAVLRTPITLSAALTVTTESSLLKVRLLNNKALEHTCAGTDDSAGTTPMFPDNAAEWPAGDPFDDQP